MSGEQRIPGSQQTVWEALNDAEVLQACIPGCESLESVSGHEHKVAMAAAVGPVRAKFTGTLRLADLDPPNAYRLRFEGKGGAAGFAKGEAAVNLKAEGEATLLSYTVHAQVGGKLAQVGSRLINGAAKKLADDFFSAFNERVAPAAEPEGGQGAPVAGSGTAPPRAGVPAWVWVAAAVAAALVVYFAVA